MEWSSVYREAVHFTQPNSTHTHATSPSQTRDGNEMTAPNITAELLPVSDANTQLTDVRNALRQFHQLFLEFPCHLRGERAVLRKW